jgi:hypothetical protein
MDGDDPIQPPKIAPIVTHTPTTFLKKPKNIVNDQPHYFMDVYQNILQPNCALSSCHDGNFEPDFTTPQAAYYTTVWHGIKKNSSDYRFTFRVVPYKLEESQLYERITNCCFNNEEDRMPLLMGKLTQTQIDSIAYWILGGAPNIYGEFPYKEYGAE